MDGQCTATHAGMLRVPEAAQVFPLEVVRRRMQTLAAEGLSQRGVMVARQAVLDIWARERLRGFYAGMLPNTVQVSTSWLHSHSRVSPERGSGC